MLMATLLFGVALGFSLGYVTFYSPRPPAAELAQTPEPNAAPAAPAAEPSASQSHSAPPAPVSALRPETAPASGPEGYWAARHLIIAVNGQWLAEGTKALLKELRPGAVLLQDVNLGSRTQTFALVKEIKAAAGLGEGLGDLPLIAVQQEGGPYNLLGIENAPSAQALGQNGDPELARKIGQQYGEACVGRGIAIAFAPVLDVFEPGAINPGFAVRSFGTEHTLVARIGLAMADGLRQGGVLPVIKHFPGYGAATYGSDGLLVALNKDAAGLGRLLYPFDQAVRRGVPGMLVAHVAVPALDPENPRRPAALSPVLVGELLRTRWGYEGVIVADDVALNPMTRSLGAEQAAVQALAAGCDAVMMLDPDPARIRAVSAAIAAAVERGMLSQEKLRQSVERLQRWQEAIGNLNPITPDAGAAQVAEAAPPAPVLETSLTPSLEPPTVQTSPPESALAPAQVETAPTPVPADASSARVTSAPGVAEIAPPISQAAPASAASPPIAEPKPAPAPAETPAAGPAVKAETEAPAAKKPEAEAPAPPPNLADAAAKAVHTVVAGETLGQIAEKYHVAAADIKLWNGLESDALEAGSVLTLFLGGATAETTPTPEAAAEPAPAPEPAKTTVAPTTVAAPAPATETPPAPEIATERYVVQAGDTINKIARKYTTTREVILRLNSLKDANQIRSGQTLKVPKLATQPSVTPDR